ncbi:MULTISPECIES: hypothetical protein [unclassified Sphingobium]|uniref:hypothetical protein n=1 Tax=unclassified Sphingobium TaxID=2611147 RepID=UPI00222415E0|nr:MULTISPECIES: hypothetical protein [unclassified Sphingobium]MCW2393799.1 hypothetical protein [Sphingobium sp. B8D3B]MCW2417313.1 hypothetical protein [Sphingobium sp. B8D3C]
MTAMIIPFVGRSEYDADRNLEAFIENARHYKFFHGANAVDWHDGTWDLRPFFSKASSTPPGLRVHFTNLETTRRGNRSADAVDLPEPYLNAAKALLVEHLRTTGENSPGRMVTVLRILERAFRDLEVPPQIQNLSASILDRAQAIIVERYKDAWTFGRYLERLAMNTLAPAQITKQRILWKTSIGYQAPVRNDRVNSDGARGRVDKLPNLQAIFDLASVFHDSDYIPDQVVTSWFALAMFAPSRVTEIIGLPVNCETEMDGIYGLSWRPLKGGGDMTKFAVTTENAEIAKIAIKRLKAISEKSRIAHRWYEENPGQLYLPPSFEHLRGNPLTLWEVAQILGRAHPITQGGRCDRALIRCGKTYDDSRLHPERLGRVQHVLVTFETLQDFVLGELPDAFPYVDKRNELKGSDALFCLPDEAMRGGASTNHYIPRYLTYSQIKHELGSKSTGLTVFARHNLTNPETGEPWRLNTHQPRHLLNTLAQSKHLSQEIIAFWSGRKNVKQNASYNHVHQETYIEAFLLLDDAAPKQLKVVGPLAGKIEERMRKESISRNTALRLEVGSTITTRFGLCRHDYSLMPCPKDKDCIRCGENTFIKGNLDHYNEAIQQLAISEKAEKLARAAMDAGRYGAQRWVDLHSEKALRWKMAVDHLTDPAIDDGTLITLPPVARPQTKSALASAIRDEEAPSTNIAVGSDNDDDDGGFSFFDLWDQRPI